MAKTRALKLQVTIADSSFENRKHAYDALFQMFCKSRKMANKAMTALYYLNAKTYIESGVKWDGNSEEKKKERAAKLKEAKDAFAEEAGAKQDTQLYRLLVTEFPGAVPTDTVSLISRSVSADYRNDLRDVLKGDRSPRQYKKGFPLSIKRKSVTFWADGEELKFRFPFKVDGEKQYIDFVFVLGRAARKNPDIVRTVQEVVSGSLPMSDSIKILHGKDAKWYANFTVEDPIKKEKVDPNKALGVDLGMAIPAFVADEKGFFSKAIGSIDEFLRVRTQMQKRRRSLQISLRHASGGKGRTKKLQAMDDLRDKERNFVKDKNHNYSRAVVNQAIKAGCGIIRMEDLSGFGRDDFEKVDGQFKRVLRNWSYYELQSMITYKAKKSGIEVELVDPAYTSQTCSACGHWEAGQRVSQSKFVCKSCGSEMNADKNAAINIARGGVDKKREK